MNLARENRPIRLLLAEDDAADIQFFQHFLEANSASADLTVVSDGVAAIEYLESADPLPDLVVLDINMPRMNGFEALEQIRTSSVWKSLPVVVLTSSTLDEDVHRASLLRANRYLGKPIEIGGYREVIEQILKLTRDVENSDPV